MRQPRDCVSGFAKVSLIKQDVKCSRILKMYEDLCHEQRKREWYVKKLMKNILSGMYMNGEQHSFYKVHLVKRKHIFLQTWCISASEPVKYLVSCSYRKRSFNN